MAEGVVLRIRRAQTFQAVETECKRPPTAREAKGMGPRDTLGAKTVPSAQTVINVYVVFQSEWQYDPIYNSLIS